MLLPRYHLTVGAGLPPSDVHVNVTVLPSTINVGAMIVGDPGGATIKTIAYH